MSDSINPIGLGTAVAAGAIAGAVTPAAATATRKVSKKVAETIATKAPKADAFIKSSKDTVKNWGTALWDNIERAYNAVKNSIIDLFGKVKGKIVKPKTIQPDLPGLEKSTLASKAKALFTKVADKTVEAAKVVNKKVLTPLGKVAKKPAVAGAILAGVAFLVLSKVLGNKEQ